VVVGGLMLARNWDFRPTDEAYLSKVMFSTACRTCVDTLVNSTPFWVNASWMFRKLRLRSGRADADGRRGFWSDS